MMLLQGLIEVVDLSLWEGDVRTSHVVGLLQLSGDLLALFDKVHQFLLGLLLLEDLQFLGHLLKARIIIFFIVLKLSSSLVLFLELALAVVLVLVITIVVFGR